MWVEEFLPQCRHLGKFDRPAPSRNQILDEVKEFFQGPLQMKTTSTDKSLSYFPSFERAYYTRILSFRKEQQIDLYPRVILTTLYQMVPKVFSVNWLGNAGRAFEDIIMKDNNTEYGVKPDLPFKTLEGLYIEPEVREFVRAS